MFRLEQRPLHAKEETRHQHDGRTEHQQRTVGDVFRGPVAHVRGARTVGHLDVMRPGPAETVEVVVRRILHVSAVPHYPYTPVNCRKKYDQTV